MPKTHNISKSSLTTLGLKKASFSRVQVLAFILVFGCIGGITLLSGQAASFTANLYVVASGGSPNCVRSSVAVDYATASSNNNVCGPGTGLLGYSTNGWNNACKAASEGNRSNGTIIGVKAGSYSKDLSDGALIKDTDCSGGLGASVNPNTAEQGGSTGSTVAWAHYQCADGNAKNVDFSTVGALEIMYASAHISVEGSCFNFNSTIDIGQGGQPANRRESEVQFVGGPGCQTDENSSDCMQMMGLDIKGAKDVLIKNVNYGPFLQCAKNDPAITAAYRCDPAVSFESKYANQGTAGTCNSSNITGCGGTFANAEQPQTYIHSGDSSVYQNVRVQNVYQHDQNQVFASNLVHSGCFMQDNDLQGLPSNNLVFDHIVCERFEIIGMQNSDSGVTVQNSVFSCPTYQLDNASPAGSWDSCAPAQPELSNGCRADLNPGCVESNVLYRYNVFLGNSIGMIFVPPGGQFGTYNNVRVIGNVFAQTPSGCGISGITCDYNSFLNGVSPVGTNSTVLAAGNPFTQTSITTPSHGWSATLLIDVHPAGSPVLPTVSNLGADYALATDGEGSVRSFPTLAGAYITPASTPPPTVTLSASPTTISSGSSSTLTWSSTNATSCSASGSWSGSKATSGSQSTGSLTTGSTFTLTCSGSGGTSSPASAQVSVTNAPPPPPPPPSTPVAVKKGDCNGDNVVNLTDLSILLSHYGQNYSLADFDNNSLVSLIDLSILLSNYGQ